MCGCPALVLGGILMRDMVFGKQVKAA